MKAISDFLKASLLILVCYSMYFTVNDYFELKETDCGIVKGHSSEEIIIKNGTITELYLTIQFEKQGFIAQEVSPTLYFKYKNGDRICLKISKKYPLIEEIFLGLGIFSFIIIGLIISCSIIWIIIDYKDFEKCFFKKNDYIKFNVS